MKKILLSLALMATPALLCAEPGQSQQYTPKVTGAADYSRRCTRQAACQRPKVGPGAAFQLFTTSSNTYLSDRVSLYTIVESTVATDTVYVGTTTTISSDNSQAITIYGGKPVPPLQLDWGPNIPVFVVPAAGNSQQTTTVSACACQ